MQAVASGLHKCHITGKCDKSKICLKSGAPREVRGVGFPAISVNNLTWTKMVDVVQSECPEADELTCVAAYSVCPISVMDHDTMALFAICQTLDFGGRLATHDQMMKEPWWLIEAERICGSEWQRLKREIEEHNHGNAIRKS